MSNFAFLAAGSRLIEELAAESRNYVRTFPREPDEVNRRGWELLLLVALIIRSAYDEHQALLPTGVIIPGGEYRRRLTFADASRGVRSRHIEGAEELELRRLCNALVHRAWHRPNGADMIANAIANRSDGRHRIWMTWPERTYEGPWQIAAFDVANFINAFQEVKDRVDALAEG